MREAAEIMSREEVVEMEDEVTAAYQSNKNGIHRTSQMIIVRGQRRQEMTSTIVSKRKT